MKTKQMKTEQLKTKMTDSHSKTYLLIHKEQLIYNKIKKQTVHHIN